MIKEIFPQFKHAISQGLLERIGKHISFKISTNYDYNSVFENTRVHLTLKNKDSYIFQIVTDCKCFRLTELIKYFDFHAIIILAHDGKGYLGGSTKQINALLENIRKIYDEEKNFFLSLDFYYFLEDFIIDINDIGKADTNLDHLEEEVEIFSNVRNICLEDSFTLLK